MDTCLICLLVTAGGRNGWKIPCLYPHRYSLTMYLRLPFSSSYLGTLFLWHRPTTPVLISLIYHPSVCLCSVAPCHASRMSAKVEVNNIARKSQQMSLVDFQETINVYSKFEAMQISQLFPGRDSFTRNAQV